MIGTSQKLTPGTPDLLALLRRAFAGESLTVDRGEHTLHDLTQIALALRPDAGLAITQAGTMSPLERASVATVGRGRVVFLS